MKLKFVLGIGLLGCMSFHCAATTQPGRPLLAFPPLVVSGDLELEKLNDEELFAAGSAAFASEDFRLAARYFGRLADFHPQSRHKSIAIYNAGLSLERLKAWDDAVNRFSELADPSNGTGTTLDASFRLAESLYHLDRFRDAIEILTVIANRSDLDLSRRLEAQVHQGICELEAGESELAEKTLRKALAIYQQTKDRDSVDDFFPAQAQFFLGEIYRLHFEAVQLTPDKGVETLQKDLEYKCELLLSAQGHYLRSIRMGNGYWATASGAQIGALYEQLYEHMVTAAAPQELNSDQVLIYREEVRKKIRILLSKAISIYERTLEAAERIGAANPFVEKTKESLQKMKTRLLEDSALDEQG